jgi:hypothetical protein
MNSMIIHSSSIKMLALSVDHHGVFSQHKRMTIDAIFDLPSIFGLNRESIEEMIPLVLAISELTILVDHLRHF